MIKIVGRKIDDPYNDGYNFSIAELGTDSQGAIFYRESEPANCKVGTYSEWTTLHESSHLINKVKEWVDPLSLHLTPALLGLLYQLCQRKELERILEGTGDREVTEWARSYLEEQNKETE